MTKVTDRLSDSTIVELAKRQYESTQKSKVPTEIVHLTSKGLVYPESHPLRKGYVNMRHMTAYDEDIITNESYINNGVMFDILLSELITDDIDIDDIATVDKDGLIVNARILGFGSDYPVTIIDPETNKSIDRIVNLAELPVTEFKLEPDSNGEFLYTIDDETTIKFKYKTGKDERNINLDHKISSFLFATIKEVNGSRSAADIEQFIKYKFSPKHSREFRKHYNLNAPTLVTDTKFEGENGRAFTAGFQLGADLFWT
jgi:hypothetical protein